MTDRIVALDVLRGFALFGLPIVHFQLFGMPEALMLDGWTYRAVYALCIMKFVALFSTVFGMSFVLQMQRKSDFGRFYPRRLVWLGVVGLLHGFLLFEGDILFPYAVGGALLYACRDWRPRSLLWTAGCLLVVGLGLQQAVAAIAPEELYGEAGIAGAEGPLPWPADEPLTTAQILDGADWTRVHRKAYEDGPLQTTLLVRAVSYVWWLLIASVSSFHIRVLACFAAGAALMKLGIFDPRRRAWLRHMAGWGLPLGLVACVASVVVDLPIALRVLLDEVGSTFLAAGYLGAVVLFAPRLRWLAPAGRMALTNYVGQSVAVNVLFLWVGFDLFGRLSRPALVGAALALFAVQVVVSSLWLQRFRQGPLEWAWRRFTYRHAG